MTTSLSTTIKEAAIFACCPGMPGITIEGNYEKHGLPWPPEPGQRLRFSTNDLAAALRVSPRIINKWARLGKHGIARATGRRGGVHLSYKAFMVLRAYFSGDAQ